MIQRADNTTQAWPSSTLPPLQRHSLRRPRRFKAEVSRVEVAGRSLVLKEITRMPWLVRITYGRILLRRELRVYTRLAGLEGIPQVVATVGEEAFLLEHVEGLPLRNQTGPHLPPDFFVRLEELVDRIHQRRVLHLDLGQRKNILVRPDGSPVILDFGSAIGTRTPKPLFHLLHLLLGWIDKRGVLMQRLRYGDGLADTKSRKQLKRFNRIRALWIFNRPTNPRRL